MVLMAAKKKLGKTSLYKASLTREQFLFHEMKTTAQLLVNGMTEEQAILHKCRSEHLFIGVY